ncbi:hypothetical protein NC652_024474 [Populus alba x Populus x berolinensis]|nr:hypothetical protein NC652_024474 [Populus alba x Populus x berolinensis]
MPRRKLNHSKPVSRSTVINRKGGSAPLPQISFVLLEGMGSLPVSYIKKYLAQKLGLVREAEVEISMRGQPVVSTLQLHTLVDWWLQTASASERIRTTVGSSAKDFVMRRNVISCNSDIGQGGRNHQCVLHHRECTADEFAKTTLLSLFQLFLQGE